MDFNLDDLDKLKKQSGRAAFKPRLNVKPKPGGSVAKAAGVCEPQVPKQAAAQQHQPSQQASARNTSGTLTAAPGQSFPAVAALQAERVDSQHAQQPDAADSQADNQQEVAATAAAAQVKPAVAISTTTAVGGKPSGPQAAQGVAANVRSIAADSQAANTCNTSTALQTQNQAARPVASEVEKSPSSAAHTAHAQEPTPSPSAADLGTAPAAAVVNNDDTGIQAQSTQGAKATAAETAATAAAALVVAAADLADLLLASRPVQTSQPLATPSQQDAAPSTAPGRATITSTVPAAPSTADAAAAPVPAAESAAAADALAAAAASISAGESTAAADALAAAAAIVSAAGLDSQPLQGTGAADAADGSVMPSTQGLQQKLPATQLLHSPFPATQPLPSPITTSTALPQQTPSLSQAAGQQGQLSLEQPRLQAQPQAQPWAQPQPQAGSGREPTSRPADQLTVRIRGQRADVDIDMMPASTSIQEPIVLMPPSEFAAVDEQAEEGEEDMLQGKGLPAQPTRASRRMQMLRARGNARRQPARSRRAVVDDSDDGDEGEHGDARSQDDTGLEAGQPRTASRGKESSHRRAGATESSRNQAKGGRRKSKLIVISSSSEADGHADERGDEEPLQDTLPDAGQQGAGRHGEPSSARKRHIILDSEEEEEQQPAQNSTRIRGGRITKPRSEQLALQQGAQPAVAVTLGTAAQGWGGLLGLAASAMAQQQKQRGPVTRSTRRRKRKAKTPSSESEAECDSTAISTSESDFIDDSSDIEGERQGPGRPKRKRQASNKARGAGASKRTRKAKSTASQEEAAREKRARRASASGRVSGGGSGGDMSDGRESNRIAAGMGPRYKQRILQELASSDHVFGLSSLPPELQDRAARLQAKGAALRAAIATFQQTAPGGSSQAGASSSPSRQSGGSQGGAAASHDNRVPGRGATPQLPPFPLPPIPEAGEATGLEVAGDGLDGSLGREPNNLQLTVVQQPQVPVLASQQVNDKALVPVPEYMQQRIGQVLQNATQKELEMALRPKPQRLPVVPADAKIDTNTWSLRHIIARTQAWDRRQLAKERAAAEERKQLEAEFAAARGPLARNEEDEFDPDMDMAEETGRPGGRQASQAPDMGEGTGEGAGMAGPRVQIGEDGRLIIDDSSLQVVAQQPLQLASYQRVEEGGRRNVNSATYMKKSSSERWSDDDTNLFYRALRAFGTDFTLIAQLFPSRDRRNVKNKFNREERDYPEEIRDALHPRSVDSQDKAKLLATIKARLQAGKPSTPTLRASASVPALPAPTTSQATHRSGSKAVTAGAAAADGNEEVVQQKAVSGSAAQKEGRKARVSVGKARGGSAASKGQPAGSSQQVSEMEGAEGDGEEGGQGEEQAHGYGGDDVGYQEEDEVYDY